jgi:Copper type II ascorbate-dependent monooxygenase, C-terminal domain
MASIRSGLVTLLAAVLVSCSSGSGSSSSSGSTNLQASIGPIPLKPSEETTVCMVMPLGNTEDVVLDGFDMKLAPGSHHLIAYLTDAAVTAPNTFACSPFTGVVIGTDIPIAFANAEDIDFSFPKGVAMDIPANSNIKIEAHYINATPNELQGHGQVTFHATPKSSAPPYQAANFMAAGTVDINIPPNSSYSTGPLFTSPPAGTHMVLVTTHEHRLGTRAQVWSSAKEGDLSNEIADDRNWASPAWRTLAPQVDFDGTNGLTYQCDWTNTTDQTIQFGESALDEMCIIAGYYYPSQGLIGCIGHDCKTRQ